MLEVLQMFLFLFKSKYRRKLEVIPLLWCVAMIFLGTTCSSVTTSKCNISDKSACGGNGVCVNETCVCYDGWQGPQCQFCGGKVRLGAATGTLHDGLGNYSVGVKCSWLIDAPNSSITLHLEEFATECGWDHLYIFDGDSVESPLLAVFSGLMYKDSYKIRKVPEVVAHSGAALIHFFSDDAYNMSGFNMTYRLNACPSILPGKDCSGNGFCLEGQCNCNGPWDGIACHIKKCPNDCGSAENRGHCEHGGCKCREGYKGHDCGQLTVNGYWESVDLKGFIPPGSASHGAAVWKDSLYIMAGESYNRGEIIYTYDLTGRIWETPQVSENPLPRYAHSTLLYGDKIFLYGGVSGNRGASAELWAFDVSAKTWENVTVRSEECNGHYLLCGPLKCAGHTATLVLDGSNKKADRMVVVFGHSPQLGYLNTVQEYYFGTREWHIVNTRGYPVKGGYGHTAAWDSYSAKIYIYGGVVSESESTQLLNRHLYSYEPTSRLWTLLSDAPSARFLHSATFITAGLMLVFGGNTHNDSSHSFGAKCYSGEALVYDVACDSWHGLPVAHAMSADLARFGHSASVFDGSLYVYGGFDGQMLADILRYTPGECEAVQGGQVACLNSRPGIKCVWDQKKARCSSITSPHSEDSVIITCPDINRTAISIAMYQSREFCEKLMDCTSCVQTTRKCVWCANTGRSYCTYERCKDDKGNMNTSLSTRVTIHDQCGGVNSAAPALCRQLHTCPACSSQPTCKWKFEIAKCDVCAVSVAVVGVTTAAVVVGGNGTSDVTAVAAAAMTTSSSATAVVETAQCQKVCAEYTSCLNCTQEECIWCQNEGRCVDKNAYTASFPYGQCREWTTVSSKCRSRGTEKSQCSYYSTCAKCRDDPACGWCDNGSRTGLGVCMPGGYTGPTLHTQSLPSSTCPSDRWHFTHCPACQCNGHATCVRNSSVCQQPCGNLTTGAHCDRCVTGYWGTPVNGGRCTPCQCNGQASQCHAETGKCYCTTKGLAGDHCEKCDGTNHYYGDPTNGSCYYDLTIDYQFTFNLSKKEDSHFTQINFKNSPTKVDIDADFSITCSERAKMNITIKKGNSREEVALYTAHNCTSFRSRFTKYEYTFGLDDNVTLTTFYVYVYDFKPPLWIQISFSQYPKLNLKQFFMTFSSCFLLLLLVAAVLWKIKQRYDMYRRRQRLFVEMEQMASRPFSQVLVEMEHRHTCQHVSYTPLVISSSIPASTTTTTNAKPSAMTDSKSSAMTNAKPTPITTVKPTPITPTVITNVTDNTVLKQRNNRKQHPTLLPDSVKQQLRDAPSPIALEPCAGNRAAVLSLLVRLPTGGEPYTARGQSAGLAIASGLVTLGNPRRLSLEQAGKGGVNGMTGGGLGDLKMSKSSRKAQSQHPDSCL